MKKPFLLEKISSSDLSIYLDCPYLFKMERILRLRAEEPVDLTMDPRERGTLNHLVFQRALDEILKLKAQSSKSLNGVLSDDKSVSSQIWSLIEAEIQDYFSRSPKGRRWFLEQESPKLYKQFEKFLTFELGWQNDFLAYEGSKTELPIYFQLNRETMDISEIRLGDSTKLSQPGPKKVQVEGRIDRVDFFRDHSGKRVALVVDYKTSSESAEYDFAHWQKKNELQLGFYLWASNKILTSRGEFLGAEEIIGTQIFDYTHFRRGRGVLIAESSLSETLGAGPAVASQTQSVPKIEIDLFCSWYEDQLNALMNEIQKSQFLAKPREKKLCFTCSWSQICRAPHLDPFQI